MNLDTPHPMNAAAGLCVLLRALGPPICGAAPDLHTGWEKDSRGADLTASVDLTAFERCDRRHKLLFEYPIIFWTPRGSLTAMAAAHPARGGIPHNTGAGMVRSWPPPLGLAA
jgi:hypothetical protein